MDPSPPPVTLLRVKRPRGTPVPDALLVAPPPKRPRHSSPSLSTLSLTPPVPLRFRRLTPAERAAALCAAGVTVVNVPLRTLRLGDKRGFEGDTDGPEVKTRRVEEVEGGDDLVLCNGEPMEAEEVEVYSPTEEGGGEEEGEVVMVSAEDLLEMVWEEEESEESAGSFDPEGESLDYPSTPEWADGGMGSDSSYEEVEWRLGDTVGEENEYF